VSKIYKSALKENKLQHGHNMAFLQISRLGFPSMYFCSLATSVCCTRQSAFILNQSKMKMKSELLADLLALHKIRRKVDTTHT
jgi:hypothetical protein